MHDKKVLNVSSLSSEERFEFFIRKVADFEVVWGLYDEGWATAALEGSVLVPLWPEEEFAKRCATDEWSDFWPRKISIDDFLYKWLAGMHLDSRLCQVFPVPGDAGVLISPFALEVALREELEKYE
ncbi:DUF2750 domain-containing protein [Pseudomonas sp. SK]|uniref:DUF2750 domain-containing protein n=1 Tax=Pseudomonas sp. SK TaxID=2729423 RepID=UPI001C49AFB0|nr:DUF2750 domain-containing protein [Pseudomonas sp. SK]